MMWSKACLGNKDPLHCSWRACSLAAATPWAAHIQGL